MPPSPRILEEIDVAAGGFLVRPGAEGPELCIVRRPRHGDWALPKGHPEESETLGEAALREVLEETGCRAEIVCVAAPISYLVGETPKLVVFYGMRLCEILGPPADTEEVSEVAWLPARQAVERLTYPSERAAVRQWLQAGVGACIQE
ncbi:MAG: NUDIX hydrolase [Myxococcales bacterium]|nr:NUDIX hydrolase [Myxococcales bacterium]